MFKHLFKLIWNKKKQNFLFLSEIFVSFLVIFVVFSFLTYYYQNYRKPLGFDYKKVWSVAYSNDKLSKDRDSLLIFYDNLSKALRAMPQVAEITFTSNNYPYSDAFMSTRLNHKGVAYDMVSQFMVGDGYQKVWNIRLLEGRWFLPEDAVSKNQTAIITERMKNQMFGKQPAVGKYIGDFNNKKQIKIIGVAADVKTNGDFIRGNDAVFSRIDTGYLKWTGTLLLKVRDNADATFESQLYKFMANTTQGTVEIKHIDEMRDARNQETIIPMTIFIIIASFLIINVALGLFGVLWYNINKRKGEIGLRRAIGASGTSVSFQLVTESMILATLSLIVGCFFAIQFPLLDVFNVPASVYIVAILMAVFFIYLLVFACSLYPGKQASGIHPAIALHED